jgi:hypothetical protein
MDDVSATDEETMVKVAVEDVRSHVTHAPRPRVEATVRRHVRSWNRRANVSNFVAIMAARDARSELLEEESRASRDAERAEDDGWVTDQWWTDTGGDGRVAGPRP